MASQEMTFAMELARQRKAELAGQAADMTAAEARAGFDAQMALMPPYEGAACEPVDAGGVPAEWVNNTATADGTVLYLHGGGYFMGSPATHRRLVSALAQAAGVRALSVDYRLAPEHPFPAGLDDAVAAYRWLTGAVGERPDRVVLAGDSAGGGLTLAALLSLRDAGDAPPAGAYLLSPWTDLAGTGESVTTRRAADPMIPADMFARVSDWYLAGGDPRQALASPVYADLSGLPPMLVQVGDAEVLLDDSIRLVDRARAVGVDATCDVWPDAFHVFQSAVGLIPEADEAVGKAATWIRRRLG